MSGDNKLSPYGTIYKVVNLINGKIYIGKTKFPFNKRIYKHKQDSKNKKNNRVIFHHALLKYGFDNFNWSIIDHAYSHSELNAKEEYWINYYKSYVGFKDCNGYNATLGGDGSWGYKPTQETLNKMSKSLKGLKRTEETKKKISQSKLGKKKSLKSRESQSKSRKGKYIGENNPSAKRVVQLTLNGEFVNIFNCLKDGQKFVNGGNNASITDCCKRKQQTAFGYIWMYEEDYEKYKNGLIELRQNIHRGNIIIFLDNKYNNLKTFKSTKEAIKETNFNYRTIVTSCKNKGSLIYNKKNRFLYLSDYNSMLESGELLKLKSEFESQGR